MQSELKKITHLDDEDKTLDQIEMLIDYFEKQRNPMTEFDDTAFEVFKLFLDGYSMNDIAVTLKSLGKLNKYGDAEWRSNTISRILQNEKYEDHSRQLLAKRK